LLEDLTQKELGTFMIDIFLKTKNKLEEITIPYHLATPTIFSLVCLVAILFYSKRLFSNNKLLWTSVTVFLVVYLLIVGSATFEDIYYQWDLNRYDLDKDGMFSGKEITAEQGKAMRKLTYDTGRNFSFITGFVFALIISTAIYISGRVLLKLKENKNKKINHI
jgi:uncharacterized membrane protein YciS (DUF1049 family)